MNTDSSVAWASRACFLHGQDAHATPGTADYTSWQFFRSCHQAPRIKPWNLNTWVGFENDILTDITRLVNYRCE